VCVCRGLSLVAVVVCLTVGLIYVLQRIDRIGDVNTRRRCGRCVVLLAVLHFGVSLPHYREGVLEGSRAPLKESEVVCWCPLVVLVQCL